MATHFCAVSIQCERISMHTFIYKILRTISEQICSVLKFIRSQSQQSDLVFDETINKMTKENR